MIKTKYASKNEVKINKKETFRYMGYVSAQPDGNIEAVAEKCINEIDAIASYKACYEVFEISSAAGELDLGFTKTKSKSLAKNLAGCEKIILFAATTGAGVDRLIQKYSLVSPVYALAMQAAGAAAIESWCDVLCGWFEEALKNNGERLVPRFSPGYGDFPLEEQKNIFNVLDCPRKIGLSLTDSLLMTPSKSVSAIAGISKSNAVCTAAHGCAVCENKHCEFRFTGEKI